MVGINWALVAVDVVCTCVGARFVRGGFDTICTFMFIFVLFVRAVLREVFRAAAEVATGC